VEKHALDRALVSSEPPERQAVGPDRLVRDARQAGGVGEQVRRERAEGGLAFCADQQARTE
jgi:hypothetical protein